MKKNIYLAQINVTYSDRIAYIPYAAGCIAAYAWSDTTIAENFICVPPFISFYIILSAFSKINIQTIN